MLHTRNPFAIFRVLLTTIREMGLPYGTGGEEIHMSIVYKRLSLFTLLVVTACPGIAEAAGEDGEVAFNTHCRNCHSVKQGDNRLAPSLHGVIGREAGKAEGFSAYSGALKGFAWDRATLDKFISDPPSVAPNTTMIYPPVKDAGERQKIIDYLEKSAKG